MDGLLAAALQRNDEKIDASAWQNIENAEAEFLRSLADNGGLADPVPGMLRHCAKLMERAARDRQIMLIDTTVKSGSALFAPTWEIVLGHKNGTVSDQAYTDEYHKLMFDSMRGHPEQWMTFVRDDTPKALACYCAPGKFCHRHLLVNLLHRVCNKHNIPFNYYGELQ